jgi:AhpC/TSA family
MKTITRIALLIMLAGTLFFCSASTDRKAEKTATPITKNQTVTNDLPNMAITFLDGLKTNAKALEGNTVLVLFQPDCDHCQREAAQIQQNIKGFKDYTLYFLAAATKQEIEKFATDYKLSGQDHVRFGIITGEDVLSNFGSISAPSLYLYSSDHKLVQQFNGEVEISVVLQYIK